MKHHHFYPVGYQRRKLAAVRSGDNIKYFTSKECNRIIDVAEEDAKLYYYSVRTDRLVSDGYIAYEKPCKADNFTWVVFSHLTDLGEQAFDALFNGFVWNHGSYSIDLVETENFYLNSLKQGMINQDKINEIEKISSEVLRNKINEKLAPFLFESVHSGRYWISARKWLQTIKNCQMLTDKDIKDVESIRSFEIRREIIQELVFLKLTAFPLDGKWYLPD